MKALLAALLLLCAGASAAQVEEERMAFTIWDGSGVVVHKAFKKDATQGQTAASPYEDVVPAREIPEVLFAPPPKYPKRLANLGMKGWVRLKFTIDEQGGVAAPEVIDMHPRKYFARAALQTISRYKFAPPMLDGKPAPLADVTVRMTFDPDR